MHYMGVLSLSSNSHCEKCSVVFHLQAMFIEHFGKSVENNSAQEEERTENFPQTSETPLFLRSLEILKTPESVEKLQFPKSPFFETYDFY